MPRRSARRPRRTDRVSSSTVVRPPKGSGWWIGSTVGLIVVGGLLAAWFLGRPSPRQAAIQAESEGHWADALASWRAINATDRADARSLLGESSAALALGLAGQAEVVLRRATREIPANPEAWLLWLELLRLEDRPIEARR